MRKLLLVCVSLGIGLGYYLIFFSPQQLQKNVLGSETTRQPEVIGFLPYWLLDKAQQDYSPYITNLTYFGLGLDNDGSILKLTSPTEEEPGWHALHTGKLRPFLTSARAHGVKTSLLIFSGNTATIDRVMDDPITHADTFVSDVVPIMQKYGFGGVHLDIEYTKDASSASRQRFTQFVREVKTKLKINKYTKLDVEISSGDIISPKLIDLVSIGKLVHAVVIMAYDYHSPSSYVTGPVAPLSGAGEVAEYDVNTAVQKIIDNVAAEKIVLGMPLYGYEWETLDPSPRSAIIPGSGYTASNRRAEELAANCATCSAKIDNIAEESYITFEDTDIGDYHQLFYPDKNSTSVKLHYAQSKGLAGVALWALGYEGESILNPLKGYK